MSLFQTTALVETESSSRNRDFEAMENDTKTLFEQVKENFIQKMWQKDNYWKHLNDKFEFASEIGARSIIRKKMKVLMHSGESSYKKLHKTFLHD